MEFSNSQNGTNVVCMKSDKPTPYLSTNATGTSHFVTRGWTFVYQFEPRQFGVFASRKSLSGTKKCTVAHF